VLPTWLRNLGTGGFDDFDPKIIELNGGQTSKPCLIARV